jgi:hypothetical protein
MDALRRMGHQMTSGHSHNGGSVGLLCLVALSQSIGKAAGEKAVAVIELAMGDARPAEQTPRLLAPSGTSNLISAPNLKCALLRS